MRIGAILALPLFCLAGIAVDGQDLDWAGVNSHSYEFSQIETTPAPKGYKPVYLSHYGRHGARTGIDLSEQYDKLISILRRADSLKILTAEGDSLYDEVLFVRAVYDDMEGRLLPRGQWEQRRLAEQIYAQYPQLFSKDCGKVRVESSVVPRSIVSGACFVQTLSSLRPGLPMTFDTGEKYMKIIDNGCSNDHYKAYKPVRDSIKKANPLKNRQIFSRIFKNEALGAEIAGDSEKFQKLIFTAARNGKASGLLTDPLRHLPKEALLKFRGDEVTSIYMRHGNSFEYGNDRMSRTEPLVRHILSQARQAVLCDDVSADLKFGHDYPLIAMAGYFGFDGVGDKLGWKDMPDGWADPMNIPYSSNMQMVIYKKKGSEALVKFVYNGRERKLRDLEAVSGPYYSWDEVYRRFMPECDERSFVTADWNWEELGGGAQSGYSRLNLFGSVQSISVVRYPMASHRTFVANDGGPQADSTSAMAIKHGGIAAINASYFNMKTLYPTTYTVDDGKLEGYTSTSELFRVDGLLAIKGHRTVKILSASDTLSYAKLAKGYGEVLAAGPVLLKDGAEARLCWPHSSFYSRRHPRTLVGTTADGWVYFVVIDGRFPKDGIGTTIHETAEIARMFGLKDAINLDGGGSSTLWTERSGVMSHPYDNRRFDHSGQRIVPNIVYMK